MDYAVQLQDFCSQLYAHMHAHVRRAHAHPVALAVKKLKFSESPQLGDELLCKTLCPFRKTSHRKNAYPEKQTLKKLSQRGQNTIVRLRVKTGFSGV